MDVFQLLDEFFMVAEVAIVITFLPKRSAGVSWRADLPPTLCRGDFQRLGDIGNRFPLRLREQQMYMVGHDYKAVHAEAVQQASPLQRCDEEVSD